jgi:hypothetical protein
VRTKFDIYFFDGPGHGVHPVSLFYSILYVRDSIVRLYNNYSRVVSVNINRVPVTYNFVTCRFFLLSMLNI